MRGFARKPANRYLYVFAEAVRVAMRSPSWPPQLLWHAPIEFVDVHSGNPEFFGNCLTRRTPVAAVESFVTDQRIDDPFVGWRIVFRIKRTSTAPSQP